jgi:hypothetical protein
MLWLVAVPVAHSEATALYIAALNNMMPSP